MHKLEISGAITNILEFVRFYLMEDSLIYNFYGKTKTCSTKKYVCRACRLYVHDKGTTFLKGIIEFRYCIINIFSKRKENNVQMRFKYTGKYAFKKKIFHCWIYLSIKLDN